MASLHPLVAAVINFPKMFVFDLIFDLKLSHVSHLHRRDLSKAVSPVPLRSLTRGFVTGPGQLA